MIMDIKDTRLRRLYEYWLQRKGGRRFPSRRDIDPVEIRYVLGWVMLIDALRDPVRFRVRLHGTGMAGEAHYDLTGKFIDELPHPEYRDMRSASATASSRAANRCSCTTTGCSISGPGTMRRCGCRSPRMIARSRRCSAR